MPDKSTPSRRPTIEKFSIGGSVIVDTPACETLQLKTLDGTASKASIQNSAPSTNLEIQLQDHFAVRRVPCEHHLRWEVQHLIELGRNPAPIMNRTTHRVEP